MQFRFSPTFSRLNRVSLVILFGALAFLVGTRNSPASDAPNYAGHYELADKKGGRAFSLEVAQDGSRATVSFAAATASSDESAPQGTGRGRIRDGVLTFAFKDTFNNEGDCKLTPYKNVYSLSMVVTKVAQPTPLHFYGDILLKRVAAQP